MAAHLRVPGAAPFAAGGAVEGRSRRRGASGAAPRFLGRCYGDAPRHPALMGVAEGGRRRGRDRRADRRRQGGWERSGDAAFAAVRRSRKRRGELWPLRAVHISVGGRGELYIAVPVGRTA